MKYDFPEGAESFPKMVVVNVSYVCNAKCIHCVHTVYPSSRKVIGDDIFISDEVFERLADECGMHGSYIRITGSGEPLLHPNILNMVKYAKKKGCKISMITNGSLLTKDKADFLLDCGIDGIEFSVDAVTKETYEKIRVGLDFDTLLKNIRYVKKRRDVLKKNTNLIVSFVEENMNKHEKSIAESFWVPDYVDKIQFRVWLTYAKLDSISERRNLMPDREPCPYPFERINMDSQGGIHLCAFDIDHRTYYGNIKDTSLEKIWRNEELDYIRDMLLKKNFDDIPICSRCTDWGCRSWEINFWKLHEDAYRVKNDNVRGLS